jgi:hypothetical protein
MLDAKLPNCFSVVRRKLELRFKFIEDYEICLGKRNRCRGDGATQRVALV